MSDEEHELSAPQENQKDNSVSYEIPLIDYVRHSGLEEGAHAVYFSIKGESKPDQVEQSIQSARSLDSERQDQSKNVQSVRSSKNLEDIKQEDIEDLIDFNNESIAPIVYNRRQAINYCMEFTKGASFPVKEVYGDKPSGVKLGLSIPPKDTAYYNFHYDSSTNTVYINRNYLEFMAQYTPDQVVTETAKIDEYASQEHERRALTWQIADARNHGLNEVADSLKYIYNKTKQ